jgi:hypothetical protein
MARKVVTWGPNAHHVVNLTGPEDVDDQVREWLTESYLNSPEA